MSDYLFTVIAYKADVHDHCRGCEVSHECSDFQIKQFSIENEAVEFMAKYYDGEYEVTLLLDGEAEPDDSIGYDVKNNMHESARMRALEINTARIAKEKHDHEQLKASADFKKKQQDLKELQRLKEKYPEMTE